MNNTLCDKGSQDTEGAQMLRQGRDESNETFEEEFGSPGAEPPLRKPVRQVRRPEIYATRKVRQETAPVLQPTPAEPRTLPREHVLTRTTSLQKPLSNQNLSQTETPWENVTLNRCLFVAIAILVFTSGCQKLHETLRGRRAAEEQEEVGLVSRQSGTLKQRGQPPEPMKSLWEVMFWWLPDLGDEDEEMRGKSQRGATARPSRRFRNKPLLDKTLMKQRKGTLKDRRAMKDKAKETTGKKEHEDSTEPNRTADDEDEGDRNEEAVLKNKKLEHKEKRKSQKG